ncbi:hypothetical protein ABZ135_12790 [Streptomyces sp. NPDC006339]|uniref:hypothetical protein n=1 Tax=Streptomyces sp. NPDC006339 TaxID=3156755 RepID=UPI00339E7E92
MADDPQATESPAGPPEDGAERKLLLKRAADAWKRRSPAWKGGAIGLAALAVTAAALAYARTKTADDTDERETAKPSGILDEVAQILEEAAAAALDEAAATSNRSDASPEPPFTEEAPEQPDGSDGAGSPPQPRRGGPVSGHDRDQCCNSRGHATGNCTHKQVKIDDYVRRGRKEEKEEEDTEV